MVLLATKEAYTKYYTASIISSACCFAYLTYFGILVIPFFLATISESNLQIKFN